MKNIFALSLASLFVIGCAVEDIRVSSETSALTQFGTVLDIYDKSTTAGWVFGEPPIGSFQTPAGSQGKIQRLSNAGKLKTKLRTTVRAGHKGHAYTLWICGFNNPGACIGATDPDNWAQDVHMTSSCALGADLMAPLTGVGANAGNAQEAFCQFADGDYADEIDGDLLLKGDANPSDLPSGAGQLLGGGITQAGIDNGEIALVAQHHGANNGDPAQINAFMGACNPTCFDEQLVAF